MRTRLTFRRRFPVRLHDFTAGRSFALGCIFLSVPTVENLGFTVQNDV